MHLIRTPEDVGKTTYFTNSGIMLRYDQQAERMAGFERYLLRTNDVAVALAKIGGHVQQDNLLQIDRITLADRHFVMEIQPQTGRELTARLAHLFGHLLFDAKYLIDNRSEFNDSPKYQYAHDHMEYRADRFAEAFLMPKGDFLGAVTQATRDRDCNVEQLAERFKVPERFAIQRGVTLGLWSNPDMTFW